MRRIGFGPAAVRCAFAVAVATYALVGLFSMTGHAGQAQVCEYKIKRLPLQEGEGLRSVSGDCGVMAALLQLGLCYRPQAIVILNY